MKKISRIYIFTDILEVILQLSLLCIYNHFLLPFIYLSSVVVVLYSEWQTFKFELKWIFSGFRWQASKYLAKYFTENYFAKCLLLHPCCFLVNIKTILIIFKMKQTLFRILRITRFSPSFIIILEEAIHAHHLHLRSLHFDFIYYFSFSFSSHWFNFFFFVCFTVTLYLFLSPLSVDLIFLLSLSLPLDFISSFFILFPLTLVLSSFFILFPLTLFLFHSLLFDIFLLFSSFPFDFISSFFLIFACFTVTLFHFLSPSLSFDFISSSFSFSSPLTFFLLFL